jgi:hypothetical protein
MSINAVVAVLAAANNFGQNLGEQAKGLAVALFLAVAGLVSLPVLGRRDVTAVSSWRSSSWCSEDSSSRRAASSW